MNDRTEALITIQGLKKYFNARNAFGEKKGRVYAVDDINLDIYRGETLSLIHI